MSGSKKRSRKSKIEVRKDDCELEVVCDDTDEHLQLLEPPPPETDPSAIVKYNPELYIPDHDYCWPFTPFRRIPYSHPKPKYIKRPKRSKTSIVGVANTSSDDQSVKIKIEPDKIPNVDFQVLEKMDVNINKNKDQDDGKIRMCKYSPDLLFKESKQIVETSDNFADKILDIEMRNLWGNVLYTPNEVPVQDIKLQTAIQAWQNWQQGSRTVREAPLFYQCHICEQAWWRLQPFRDHIRNHDNAKLIVSMKEHLHESFIIASYEIVNKLIYIPINDGDCYRCGENVEFHKDQCLAYTCTRCSKFVYTCSSLRAHEAMCLYVNLVIYNISVERQCTLCNHVLNSITLMKKHMVEAHSVRSDIPVSIWTKNCAVCKEKYFTFSMHNCCKSGRNCSCKHCCRKFASNKLANYHMLGMHNKPFHCRICNLELETKCKEMEHLVEYHMSSYQMVFNCTICLDKNLFFMDEKSTVLHRQLWHQKKYDKRRLFFEKMLVPKTCINEHSIEEAVLAGIVPKKPPQKKKENKKIEDLGQPSNSFSVLIADVNVTVDEIDVKKEPMDVEDNEEVGYEEMLLKMFNETPDIPAEGKVKSACKEEEPNSTEAFKFDQVYKTEEHTGFDYSSVKIKAEPMDDIEIIENSVEEVQIKTEPIDPSEIDDEIIKECNYDEASVKIERNDEVDDFVIENPIESGDPTSVDKISSNDPSNSQVGIDEDELIIKDEIDDTISIETEDDVEVSPSEPFHKIITELEMFKHDHETRSKFKYEYSIEVVNSEGKLKQKKMYTCRKCGYTAHHKKYRKHMVTKCLVSPGSNCSYPCTLCGLKFVMFKNYVLHFEKHGYDLMTCFLCGAKFEVEFKFLSHMHKHIKGSFVGVHMLDKSGEEIKRSQKRVTCMNCKQTVDQNTMFLHWEKLHRKLMDIKSEEESTLVIKEEPTPELTVDCERVTMNNKELEPAMLKLATDHLQMTSTNKECIICYRVFARHYDLKRHLVEHLLMDAYMKKIKYREFRCQICSDGFPHQDRYKFHMRGHGNMPIFMCELCNKTFSDSSNFAKHKKTHNVRCLVCDICKKKFHSKLALEKHIGEHYSKPLTTCMYCTRTFLSKTSFKKHKYQVHQKPRYRCILCDLFFVTVQSKWDHDWEVHQERKHVADCPICLKSFRKFADVKVHARSEHNADVNLIKNSRVKVSTAEKNPLMYNIKDRTLKKKEKKVVCE